MAPLVRDWMSSPAIFVDADANVAQATTLMRRRNIHSLVVALEHGAYGIVTTTDVRDKIMGAERDPNSTRVREILTTPVITARPAWSLRECSLTMRSANIHHMPVVDEQDQIIGLISATDIFTAVEELGWQAYY